MKASSWCESFPPQLAVQIINYCLGMHLVSWKARRTSEVNCLCILWMSACYKQITSRIYIIFEGLLRIFRQFFTFRMKERICKYSGFYIRFLVYSLYRYTYCMYIQMYITEFQKMYILLFSHFVSLVVALFFSILGNSDWKETINTWSTIQEN